MLKSKTGFTLLEIVIYVGILGIISVLVINSILATSTSFAKSRVKRNLNTQAGEAVERILRELRLATSVNTGASTLGSHPGRLVLNTVVSPSDGTAITREFFLSGTTLILRETGTADTNLISDIDVTNLVFRRITTPNSQAVRIEMTAEDGFHKTLSSAKYYGTAILRGSY